MNDDLVSHQTVTLVAKEYGQRVGISDTQLATMRIEQTMDYTIGQLLMSIRGFLYGETLLTEVRKIPFSKTVTTWGHTGKLVAWYAPWFGRRWEATEVTVHGDVAVRAEHFAAYPDLPIRTPDWGRPIRMTFTDLA